RPAAERQSRRAGHARGAPHSMKRQAIAVVILALAGCSIDSGPKALRKYEPPRDATSALEPRLQGVASAPGEKGFTATFWPVPMWMSGRLNEVAADGDGVSSTAFTLAGVVAIPWLPVWLSTTSQLDRRTGEHATHSATWSLLFTDTAEGSWPPEVPAM